MLTSLPLLNWMCIQGAATWTHRYQKGEKILFSVDALGHVLQMLQDVEADSVLTV